MSAVAVDLRQPEAVAHALGAANRRLARDEETPASVVGLVEDVADAIAGGRDHEMATVNPWLWIAVQRAALRAQSALREDDPARRRHLRLALEQLRFLFARIADRQPVGEDRPAAAIVRWLEDTLASVSQQRKAELLGVSLRTYQRWVSERETATPSAPDDRRLRVVARIVNQLRHSLTAPGVIDWFEHPRADLGGARPADLLDDADRLEALLAAAAASRGNVAA
jgi:uncharacterized protein (DUF2384 family)